MNFDDAITAHIEWKIRLRVFLAEPQQGGLDPDEIEKHDRCQLGIWIHGEGVTHTADPVFQKLREEHRRFHATAAEVVRKARAGETQSAEELMSGEYLTRSAAVVSAIAAMKRRAAHREQARPQNE
jgi:hypothetical protein